MAKPVKEKSLGHCKAAVFHNEQFNSYSVKFQKSYKDKQGVWKNTEYFNLTDLRDLYALVGNMLMAQVKERTPGEAPTQAPAQTPQQFTPQQVAQEISQQPGIPDDDSSVPF